MKMTHLLALNGIKILRIASHRDRRKKTFAKVIMEVILNFLLILLD